MTDATAITLAIFGPGLILCTVTAGIVLALMWR